MSLHPTPRGFTRAARRACLREQHAIAQAQAEQWREYERDDAERRQLYRDLRDEGYSREQALLTSGLADPDSLNGRYFT